MSTTILAKIVSPDTAASLAGFVPASTTVPTTDGMWRGLATFSNAVLNGSRNAQLKINLAGSGDQKSFETITFSAALITANDYITIGGLGSRVSGGSVTFTAKAAASVTEQTHFAVGSVNSIVGYREQAVSLVSKINAHPALQGLVTALSHDGVVTVSAGTSFIGSAGDVITLTLSDGITGTAVGHGHLQNGASNAAAAASQILTCTDVFVADNTVIIGKTTLTAKAAPTGAVQFGLGTAGTGAETAAINIAACINACTTDGLNQLWSASVAAGVVTLTAKTNGVWANHVTLGGTMTNAAWTATLPTGGVDESFITLDKS